MVTASHIVRGRLAQEVPGAPGGPTAWRFSEELVDGGGQGDVGHDQLGDTVKGFLGR